MLEIDYNKKMSEVNSKYSDEYGLSSEGAIVKDREDLGRIIEAPCLEACLALYDKNIQTVNSSANRREIGGEAYIGINYDSLDENNKRILEQLIQEGIIEPKVLSDNPEDRGGRDIMIKVPVYEEDTVGTVSDRFMRIVSAFQQQDVLYGRHTEEEIYQVLLSYGLSSERSNPNKKVLFETEEAKTILEILEYQYDEELDIYWETQDLYEKHKRFQEGQKGSEIKAKAI